MSSQRDKTRPLRKGSHTFRLAQPSQPSTLPKLDSFPWATTCRCITTVVSEAESGRRELYGNWSRSALQPN